MGTVKNKLALGKGLGALLPQGAKSQTNENLTANSEFFDFIEIASIIINPYQPRTDFDTVALQELSDSIKKHGLLQPITVRRVNDAFELISGERRFRASKLAGLHKIPAYIIKIDQDVKLLEMALIENVQRVDLNPIELASGYQRLIEECNYTQEQVADRVGKERSTITNLIRLLKLPEKVQEDLRVGLITIGHARSLLGLSSKSDIIALEKEILTKGLSVRQVERIVKDFQLGKVKFENNKIAPIVNKEKNDLQESLKIFLREKETNLQHRLGTKVSIKAKTEDTGVIEIEFYSKEEFERITEIIEQMQPSVKL